MLGFEAFVMIIPETDTYVTFSNISGIGQNVLFDLSYYDARFPDSRHGMPDVP